jgi:hypothetical protein
MSTRCPKCGAEVEDGWTVCRKCFEPVKRKGFLSRLFGALGVKVTVSKTSDLVPGMTGHILNFNINERIKIRDGKTGEVREYHSLDEVPEEFREKIRQAQAMLSEKSTMRITITDASGTTRHYNSIEEMPPDIKALYEKGRGCG